MAVRVLCSNPNCSHSFSVDPGRLGTGRCPKCGWPLDPDAEPSGSEFPAGPPPVPAPEPAFDLPNPFAERYQLIKVLGRGGMGQVYLAQDTQLKRKVALKVPLVSPDEDPEFLKRFQREAYALAQFHHPNICPVYDVGNHNGQPFLVMAFIEGSPLSEYVKQGKVPLDPSKACRLVRVLATALQKAHEARILHRDLKPSNIMISPEGRPVIMDFGLARRDDPEESLRTKTGQMMGTPAYMALEQFRGDVHAMGPGCDIYSLGVILYQLLTGRLPYEGSPVLVLERLLTGDPPPLPPSSHRRGLDSELEAICLKAMARQIEDRYVSMAEFARALGDYLGHASGPPRGRRPTGAGPGKKIGTVGTPKAALASAEPDFLITQPDDRWPILSDEPLPETEPVRRGINDSWRWVLAGAFGLLVALAIVIYVVTDTGTLKIKGADANMLVHVDGRKVRIENLGEPITLRTGTHELLVTRGELVVTTKSFQIVRGRERILDVTFTRKPATDLARVEAKPGSEPSAVPKVAPSAGKESGTADSKTAAESVAKEKSASAVPKETPLATEESGGAGSKAGAEPVATKSSPAAVPKATPLAEKESQRAEGEAPANPVATKTSQSAVPKETPLAENESGRAVRKAAAEAAATKSSPAEVPKVTPLAEREPDKAATGGSEGPGSRASGLRESPSKPPVTPRPDVGARPGEERDDNGLKMKFCWCPAGSFRMGSPLDEPERQSDEGPVNVALSRGFWIGKYEVTQSQWRLVMGTSLEDQRRKAGLPAELYGEGKDYPMYFVSQSEAEEFCRKLTESERAAGRLSVAWTYRLPTEAQWEYACRAGTTTATAFGDRLGSQEANFDGNYPYNGAPKGPYLAGTAPIGR